MRAHRLTILVSEEEKEAIVARSRELGFSVGETLRLAFHTAAGTSLDDAVLDAFAADVERTMEQAEARIDAALSSAERVLAELRGARRAASAA